MPTKPIWLQNTLLYVGFGPPNIRKSHAYGTIWLDVISGQSYRLLNSSYQSLTCLSWPSANVYLDQIRKVMGYAD